MSVSLNAPYSFPPNIQSITDPSFDSIRVQGLSRRISIEMKGPSCSIKTKGTEREGERDRERKRREKKRKREEEEKGKGKREIVKEKRADCH